ncbi:MAG: ribbon-helix-helix protein, CopG family [Sphingomonadaceae bacterium]|nr:ribbon-helix-helix protein, CopG family [Sphingomonadaceae bacterium]
MLAVRLEPELEKRLNAVAKRTGRSKSYYVRQALIEKIEELEDIALLEEALRDPDAGKSRSLDEVARQLGLDA